MHAAGLGTELRSCESPGPNTGTATPGADFATLLTSPHMFSVSYAALQARFHHPRRLALRCAKEQGGPGGGQAVNLRACRVANMNKTLGQDSNAGLTEGWGERDLARPEGNEKVVLMTITGLARFIWLSLVYPNAIPGCERVVTTRRETFAFQTSSIRASRHSRIPTPRIELR